VASKTPRPKETAAELGAAEDRFRAALETFPRSPSLLARLGKCLVLQGRVEDAVECLLSSLELDPAQPALLLRVADLFATLGRYEEAMRFYEHYQSLRPSSARGYARMGDLLLRQRFYYSAADAYSKAIEREPESRLLRGRLDGALRLRMETPGL